MKRGLRIGNAITIVVGKQARRANIARWLGANVFRWKGYSGTYGELNLAEEGITWIRDHHELTSKEVKALLVAGAL